MTTLTAPSVETTGGPPAEHEISINHGLAMTYVVYWQDVFGEYQGVLKVGRTNDRRRLEMMRISGGQFILLAHYTDRTWETHALRELRRWFPKAFANEDEAEIVLFRGRGWTECFHVDEYHLNLAVKLCIRGFARGTDRSVDREIRAAANHAEGPAIHPIPEGTTGGESDRPGPVVTHRPTGPAGANPGADRSIDLPGGSGNDTDRGAPTDPRGDRLPDDLPIDSSRRSGVDRIAPPTIGGRATSSIFMPGTTPEPDSRTFANIRGYGGGEREGAGAGEREPRRGPEASKQERARAWVQAESAERSGRWAGWEGTQEHKPQPPRRPLLLDAPPIGCPDHPHGRFANCGPCGTARRRHDKFLAQERYTQEVEEYLAATEDDEPDIDDHPDDDPESSHWVPEGWPTDEF